MHGNAKENCEKARRNVSIIIVTNLLSKFYNKCLNSILSNYLIFSKSKKFCIKYIFPTIISFQFLCTFRVLK